MCVILSSVMETQASLNTYESCVWISGKTFLFLFLQKVILIYNALDKGDSIIA